MNWTTKTKNESEIEQKGFEGKIKPILNRIAESWEVFAPDTFEQKNLKVDGIAKTFNGVYFYMENKIVNGEYPSIYAEFLAEPDDYPPRAGWIEIPTKVDKPTLLFYCMTDTVYIYNMDKLKAWYQQQDHSKWRVSKIRDRSLNQWMSGYLIPVKEIEQFCIYKA